MTEWPDFAGLTDHQLLQRDAHDVATITLQGAAPAAWEGVIAVGSQVAGRVTGGRWQCSFQLRTGGPYDVRLSMRNTAGAELATREIADLLVGDIWLLAGQSNMLGRGTLVDVETPSPQVRSFDLAERWVTAEEPLHRFWEARDPVYHSQTRTDGVGAGLGLTFAKAISTAEHTPVGLIPCAFGGSSISQWKDSLYGAMLRRLHLAGGKARGVLWYQGEADARDPKMAPLYGQNLKDLISAARKDTGTSGLGFYVVQTGRMLDWPYYGVDGRTPPPTLDQQFSQVREAQRLIGSGTVAAIDLTLHDAIHLATADLKRVGRRLANIVQRQGSRLERIAHDPHAHRISVRFSGVTESFDANGRITGFSLRTTAGAEIAAIYRAEVDTNDPATIVLSYQGRLPADARLAYGWGVNPYCNLVDHADMAVPCFGPVELDYASE